LTGTANAAALIADAVDERVTTSGDASPVPKQFW
jgi:hypothetical protein